MLGTPLGVSVLGATVGITVGSLLGFNVGVNDGCFVVGEAVMVKVGFLVGVVVVGTSVEGVAVKVKVGFLEGGREGLAVDVGLTVGTRVVGFWVGLIVGGALTKTREISSSAIPLPTNERTVLALVATKDEEYMV